MKFLVPSMAWRIARGSYQQKKLSLMIIISLLTIGISTFALTLMSCIMAGLEQCTIAALQGIHPQITLRSYGQSLHTAHINAVLTNEFPEISLHSPGATHQVIILRASDNSPHALQLEAIDLEKDPLMPTIRSLIKAPSISEQSHTLLREKGIILGSTLAAQLGVAVGDAVTIVSSSNEDDDSELLFSQHHVRVKALFYSGIDEIDTSVAFISWTEMAQLFPDIGTTHIHIKTHVNVDEQQLVSRLRARFGMEAYSWKDLYPALVSVLTLEKVAMFIIMTLIMLVASMNIISLVSMHIAQQRPTIALLYSLGMTMKSIKQIFMIIGITIATIACIIGLSLAACIGYLLKHYPCFRLPDLYYTRYLPVELNTIIFITIAVLVLLLSGVATWIACRSLQHLKCAQVVRFES